jgi:hypothetical protein
MNKIKHFLTELDWRWDYYFAIFLYNPNKVHHYNRYMTRKWGSRYTGEKK